MSTHTSVRATPAGPASFARATRTKALLDAPIDVTLATLAAPNILAVFVQATQNTAEAYFASVLGITILAGLALVFPLVMLTQMLSASAMGGAISASAARALGSDDPQRAASLTLVAWMIGTGLALSMAGGLALGWGGLPSIGIAGLPLGLVVAFGFGALVAIGYILSGRTGLKFTGAFGRINLGMFTDILKAGAMASINAVLTVLRTTLHPAMTCRIL